MVDDTTQPSYFKFCLSPIAVRRKDCIVFLKSDGFDITPEIWIYNLWTEQWKTCQPLKGNGLPSRIDVVGVEIRSVIYLFDSYSFEHMWKLIPLRDNLFQGSKISIGKNAVKLPAPRQHCSVWTYEDKMWIFGGSGRYFGRHYFIDAYGYFEMYGSWASNNQLLSYCPFTDIWTNVECLGDVPSSRSRAFSAIIKDKAWLYGGEGAAYEKFYDLYELNMHSLTWTQTDIGTSRPELLFTSLTPITTNQLVLRGWSTLSTPWSTWILNIESNKWEEYTVSAEICYDKCQHRATTGLTSDVIDIVAHHPACNRHKSLLSVMLEPRRLQQLAMKIIYKYQSTLPWQSLPKSLLCKLMGQLIRWYCHCVCVQNLEHNKTFCT